MAFCHRFFHKANAKVIHSFCFYKFLLIILNNIGKKQVLFPFSFGFFGFFS